MSGRNLVSASPQTIERILRAINAGKDEFTPKTLRWIGANSVDPYLIIDELKRHFAEGRTVFEKWPKEPDATKPIPSTYEGSLSLWGDDEESVYMEIQTNENFLQVRLGIHGHTTSTILPQYSTDT